MFATYLLDPFIRLLICVCWWYGQVLQLSTFGWYVVMLWHDHISCPELSVSKQITQNPESVSIRSTVPMVPSILLTGATGCSIVEFTISCIGWSSGSPLETILFWAADLFWTFLITHACRGQNIGPRAYGSALCGRDHSPQVRWTSASEPFQWHTSQNGASCTCYRAVVFYPLPRGLHPC